MPAADPLVAPQGDVDADLPLSELCRCRWTKPLPSTPLGLVLTASPDGGMAVVASIEPGSLASTSSELRPGARLVALAGGGRRLSRPTPQQACDFLCSAKEDVEAVFSPLTDRNGFIIINN